MLRLLSLTSLAALTACIASPYYPVVLPLTAEKLPARVEIRFDTAMRIPTQDTISGANYIEDITLIRGDAIRLRNDTLFVHMDVVGYKSGLILDRSGLAYVPFSSAKVTNARHIPSDAEMRSYEKKTNARGVTLAIVLTVASIGLSWWLTWLLNKP